MSDKDFVHHPNGYQDLNTGKLYDNDGNEVQPGLGDSTKEALLRQLAPRTATLVGNVADLQVHGAELAADSSNEDAKLPSSPIHNLVKTPPQAEPQVAPKEVFEADEAPAVEVTETTADKVDDDKASATASKATPATETKEDK